MGDNRIKYSISLYLVIYAIYIFWATSGYGSIGNYLASGFCLILIILDFPRHSHVYSLNKNEDKCVLFFMIFFLFHLVTSAINVTDLKYWVGNVAVYVFVSYFPVILQRNYSMIRDLSFLKRVLRITSYIWLFMVLFSVVYYILHPDTARDAIVFQEKYDNLFIGGGYFLAYGSCILAVFLFGLLRNGVFKVKKEKVIVLAIVALLSIHVLLTKSTLTTIWLVLGLIMDLLFGMHVSSAISRNNKKLVIGVIVLALVVGYVGFSDNIGRYLMQTFNYSSDSLYSRRMYELGTVLEGAARTRHTLERFSKPAMSWARFLESPLIGIGYKYGYTYSEMKTAGLGTHSEIVDTLAKYGIIGTIPWILLFWNLILSIQKRFRQNATYTWVIILILMMIFNPFISMPSMIALCLIIPVISIIWSQETEEII